MNTPVKHYIWRAETIRRINLLLDTAKSKKKMYTRDFYSLIDYAEILQMVDSKVIKVIEDYKLIEGNKAFTELLKLGDDFDKIRKFIGQAKTCNVYYLDNGELKNVDRKLFIEIAEKMLKVLAEEMLDFENDFQEEMKQEV